MTPAPGTKLGAYEILAPLGAGGMGEVWRARDSRLQRDVAIKVLPADVAANADRLARFEREARTVAGLNHPNIVTLYAVEEADGTRFLAMELVDGRTLDHLVAAGGLPLPRLLELAIPLADALAAAHARGVVHRDLKPGNVMVTRDGRVKVLDFGLAKVADDGPLDATQAATVVSPLSTAGQVVGTVPYMSPEQLRGANVDARTDLFSLGILLYEMATGRRPFAGATSAEVTSAILRDAVPPARTLRGDLPADLERILARCLEKDRERRFQTAKDVRNELELVRGALSSAGPLPSSGTASAVREAPSIAVLPFASRSRDAEDEDFVDGLADELMGVLGRIRGLRVAARTSSRQFKGHAEDPAVIGRKLNVTTLLEGSVRKSSNRVRIVVQLVNAADGFQLWSGTYDRTLDDIFAVQDDIAQSVVKELRAQLLGAEPDSKASGEVKAEVEAAVAGRGTSAEAHRLYLQGRAISMRIVDADMTRGVELLRRAVELDPAHARAWAALSQAEAVAGALGGHDHTIDDSLARARVAAHRALELAPGLSDGHVALGILQQWYEFDFAGASASYHRALDLAPDDVDVLRVLGSLDYCLGRFDEAVRVLERVVELDPLSVMSYSYLARTFSAMNRLDDCEAMLRKQLDLSQSSAGARGMLAAVLLAQGRADEALASAEAEEAEWSRLYSLAILHHHLGRHAESDAELSALISRWADKAAYQIAQVHAQRGEMDAAFEWLDRAIDIRDPGAAAARVTRLLIPMHADPRWPAVLRRLGLEG